MAKGRAQSVKRQEPEIAFKQVKSKVRSPIVRVDRNLARWPLWTPSNNSNNRLEARIIERPKGQRVIINPIPRYGDLTTEDQRTLVGLIKLWDIAGRPIGLVPLKIRELAKILKKKWGGETYKTLVNSLKRLRGVLLEWEESYVDGETLETLDQVYPFNILSDLKFATRRVGGEITQEGGYFRFNKHVLKNLLSKHTKPFLLDILLSFKTDYAQIFYNHFDLMLQGRRRYERCTKELFEEVDLLSERYRFPSKRKQKLESVIPELKGAPLVTGRIKDLWLEKTSNNRDYKIIVLKGARIEDTRSEDMEACREITFRHSIRSKEYREGEKLVKLFYEVFFQVKDTSNASIPEKAVEQAVALIAELGYDKAAFLVEFAFKRSKESKAKPFAFGWIFHFKAQALKEYDKAVEQRERASRVERQRKLAEERRKAEEEALPKPSREEIEMMFRDFHRKYGKREKGA